MSGAPRVVSHQELARFISDALKAAGASAADAAGGVNVDREQLRDPHAGFVAYVPMGTLEKGRRLAACFGSGLVCYELRPHFSGGTLRKSPGGS